MIDVSGTSGARVVPPTLFGDAKRLGRAIEAGGAALWEWHIADGTMQVSPRFAELLWLDPPLVAFPADRFFALVVPSDIALLRAAMREAMASDAAFVHEFRVRRENNGSLRFLCTEGRVVERDADGGARILAGISHDVTERRLKQEASELLNRELSHRIKNLLSIVGSIATMSSGQRPETREYVAAFQARLNNLAGAHDLLIQAEWEPILLEGLAEKTLAAIGVRDRVQLAASELMLGSHDTQIVALVLHELGTNAIKYGALSVPDGRVRLRCEIVRDSGEDEAPTLRMLWEEEGGPPVVPPSAKGFGVNLLERLARRQEPDAPVLDWAPQGLRCNVTLRITPPLRKPRSSADGTA